MARILLIDDDDNLREVVSFILTEAGHEVLPAGSGEEGLAKLTDRPDVVITDVKMPGINGMEVLRRIQDTSLSGDAPPVIMLTAHGTVSQAVTAMQLGAFTYLLKPFAREELNLTVDRALQKRHLEHDNARLRTLLQQRRETPGFIYQATPMKQLMADLQQAAPSDAAIVIMGESGTGKELAARACHDLSPRWDQSFIAVNCGAIPAHLVESELFGHVKGAFTGADKAATGRIRAAHKGTLFLDEIAELPLELQPKLLRVLEEHSVDPVGSHKPVTVDFRLVCATNKDLQTEVAAGRFREDLLYRINVLPLTLPPLRERASDIPLLWDHFTQLHAGQTIESEAAVMDNLKTRAWRGNVRELKNLNQRLVLMRRGEKITLSDLNRLAPASGSAPRVAAHIPDGLPLGPLPETGVSLIALETEVIRQALQMCGGNRSKTAAFLDIPRHILVYRLSKYGLE